MEGWVALVPILSLYIVESMIITVLHRVPKKEDTLIFDITSPYFGVLCGRASRVEQFASGSSSRGQFTLF